jgi:hypothetical protein
MHGINENVYVNKDPWTLRFRGMAYVKDKRLPSAAAVPVLQDFHHEPSPLTLQHQLFCRRRDVAVLVCEPSSCSMLKAINKNFHRDG